MKNESHKSYEHDGEDTKTPVSKDRWNTADHHRIISHHFQEQRTKIMKTSEAQEEKMTSSNQDDQDLGGDFWEHVLIFIPSLSHICNIGC